MVYIKIKRRKKKKKNGKIIRFTITMLRYCYNKKVQIKEIKNTVN